MMEMIKLLFLCNSTNTVAGNEKTVLLLAEHLDRAKFELRVVLDGYGPFYDRLCQLNVSTEVLPACGRYSVAWHRKLTRYLRGNNIDVCQLHMSRLNAPLLKRTGGVRVVERLNMTRHRDFFYPMRWRWLDRFSARWIDQFIVVSQTLRDQFIGRGYPESKLSVIYNGVDVPSELSASTLKSELGLPADTPVVGTLGRLTRQKGIDTFIKAAAMVHSRMGDVHFVVAGEGELREELEGLAKAEGLQERMHWLGYRQDAQNVLAGLDIAAVLSRWEPFANVILEAMAVGTPLVASKAGGNTEALDDGVSGVLVPPEKPQDAANILCRLLEDKDKRKRMADAARERARRFSIDSMIEAHERLYRKLAGK